MKSGFIELTFAVLVIVWMIFLTARKENSIIRSNQIENRVEILEKKLDETRYLLENQQDTIIINIQNFKTK